MTQEDKELLLKDLSARLPYEIKVHCKWNMFQGDRISEYGELVSINTYAKSIHFKRNSGRITEIPFNRIDGTVLPYLRPMSSMTEEEHEEFENLLEGIVDGIERWDKPDLCEEYDWLNAHHFDYRNLIEKGLALEAPEGLYELKEK